MSCSLACTQSHKIYCAPKTSPSHEEPPPLTQSLSDAHGDTPSDQKKRMATPGAIAASPELKDLLQRCPQLRGQLQDTYQTTLEEEWVEWHPPAGRGRSRGGSARRSRGPWTAEKGFNRGLGKVRQLRQRCEAGLETGPGAEGFMQFLALVTQEHNATE
ncbi:uncharacterized protein PFLUO_LOCUS7263 [Penicillium psychrofluorescens]|uniref:uncharacterized protein n=1 Tax=Penicillium psychrofluorescens TaxID=3158075 RepID=UPI003CCCD07F